MVAPGNSCLLPLIPKSRYNVGKADVVVCQDAATSAAGEDSSDGERQPPPPPRAAEPAVAPDPAIGGVVATVGPKPLPPPLSVRRSSGSSAEAPKLPRLPSANPSVTGHEALSRIARSGRGQLTAPSYRSVAELVRVQLRTSTTSGEPSAPQHKKLPPQHHLPPLPAKMHASSSAPQLREAPEASGADGSLSYKQMVKRPRRPEAPILEEAESVGTEAPQAEDAGPASAAESPAAGESSAQSLSDGEADEELGEASPANADEPRPDDGGLSAATSPGAPAPPPTEASTPSAAGAVDPEDDPEAALALLHRSRRMVRVVDGGEQQEPPPPQRRSGSEPAPPRLGQRGRPAQPPPLPPGLASSGGGSQSSTGPLKHQSVPPGKRRASALGVLQAAQKGGSNSGKQQPAVPVNAHVDLGHAGWMDEARTDAHFPVQKEKEKAKPRRKRQRSQKKGTSRHGSSSAADSEEGEPGSNEEEVAPKGDPVELLRQHLKLRFGSPKKAFKALDYNGNGLLSYGELKTSLSQLGINWTEVTGCRDLHKIFKIMDSAGVGELTMYTLMGVQQAEQEEVDEWQFLNTAEKWTRWCDLTHTALKAKVAMGGLRQADEDINSIRCALEEKRNKDHFRMRLMIAQGLHRTKAGLQLTAWHLPKDLDREVVLRQRREALEKVDKQSKRIRYAIIKTKEKSMELRQCSQVLRRFTEEDKRRMHMEDIREKRKGQTGLKGVFNADILNLFGEDPKQKEAQNLASLLGLAVEEVARIQELFDVHERDGAGVPLESFAALVHAVLGEELSAAQANEAFRSIDKEGKGHIMLSDFLAWQQHHQQVVAHSHTKHGAAGPSGGGVHLSPTGAARRRGERSHTKGATSAPPGAVAAR